MMRPPVTNCDAGTQTDTHFVQSNIVKSYEWNEWELRRNAIKLVILCCNKNVLYAYAIVGCDCYRQIYVRKWHTLYKVTFHIIHETKTLKCTYQSKCAFLESKILKKVLSTSDFYRNNMTQTVRDLNIGVPKPSAYLAGLRGQDIPSRRVDLTLPVEQHINISS